MDEMVKRNLFGGIYKDKKVLITGHTGFKGSWLALWLKQMGANVCGYALEPDSDPAHFILLNMNVQSQIGDIRNLEQLSTIIKEFQPEIVFHLAAQPLVRLSYDEPIDTYSTNVMGTLNLLEACRLTDSVRSIIVVTSDKCYENKEWPWGYRENDPMGGFDPYSSSKGCVELLTASYRSSYFNISDYKTKHNTLLATVRAGNVIGGGDWAKDRLIPDAMKATSINESVYIRNPVATRPWQHVLEPLSGYLLLGQKLLEQEVGYASAWNFGPEPTGTLNVGQVLKMAKEAWEEINFKFDDNEHPHEAGLLKLDCSKANQYLQWKEVLGINKTIEFTIQWYKEYYKSGIVSSNKQLEEYVSLAQKKKLVWTK